MNADQKEICEILLQTAGPDIGERRKQGHDQENYQKEKQEDKADQGFTYDEVESVLRQLFQEQYTLSFSEETEIRYRTETSVDQETGEETQEEVPYEWRILNVKLDCAQVILVFVIAGAV